MYGSPVQLDELPNDGQPEIESRVTLGRRVIGLAEALEHVWQKVRADALSRIDDPELDAIVQAFDENINTSAGGREFNRIPNQIPDHLLQPARVSVDGCGGREIG